MALRRAVQHQVDERAVDGAFRKLHRLMTDERFQNSTYVPKLQLLLGYGGGVDQVTGASGEFGRSLSNPVPVNGPLGELVYISNLTAPSSAQMIGHRLCAQDRIDVYELVALDGSHWDVLFFDYYHNRKSRLLPSGYHRMARPEPFFLATNRVVQSFPAGIHDALRAFTAAVIGAPMVSPQLRDDGRFRGFVRPREHLAILQSLSLTWNLEGQA